MLVIKVSATDSTNLHLKRLMGETELQDFTVLVADSQEKGRGQAGSQWMAQAGKNLTFSVLKKFRKQDASEGFLISKAVSLALIEVFRKLGIPELSIKWPNDIMSGSRKICGILIENTLKGKQLASSVVGIGINVNQESFEGLPHAASLFQISGELYELNTVLDSVLLTLQEHFRKLDGTQATAVHGAYDGLLFLKDSKADFEIGGEVVAGVIRGVSSEGKLLVEINGIPKAYGLKEIAYRL